MGLKNIRNFCIIAHIDHGKSTLADRFLECTGTVLKRDMKEQLLDQMSIERERGITIKLQPVSMNYISAGEPYTLNLIDTPGHVDFSYEVSRSLAAVEGAVLLIDATQGVQAQTLANLYLALEQNLTIIPVLNKIDLPAARIDAVKKEVVELLGGDENDILLSSGKTGEGVEKILARVIERVPAPKSALLSTRALVFDSQFDEYRGVVTYVRVFDGSIQKGDRIRFFVSGAVLEVLEVGVFKPKMVPIPVLESGQIGYVVTGIKDISQSKVGDTLMSEKEKNILPLAGYEEVKPMVFSGVFTREGDEYTQLREAMEKLKLNDASLQYEPEHSSALGFGFRCGFLGLLHAEIFMERLKREFGLSPVMTIPTVSYRMVLTNNEIKNIRSPQDLPEAHYIRSLEEPFMLVDVVTPREYVGALMQFFAERRGVYKTTEYLREERAILHYEMPLSQLLVDFYDKVKSLSAGYASVNYELSRYSPVKVVRLDILVAEEPVEALSLIVYTDEAHKIGKKVVEILKDVIPRQQFAVKIQAAVGGKIVAAERITPFRKDVTAKLYGGDITRKRKLWDKQKKGKKRMMGTGRVEIPPDAYLAVLKQQ